MLIGLLVAIHLIASIFLILIVLLQTGKGQDLASAFGGGAGQAVFGASGAATLLHKLTVTAAIVFMFTSLLLSIMWAAPSGSVLEEQSIPQDVQIPGQPQPAPIEDASGAEPVVPDSSQQAPSEAEQQAPAPDSSSQEAPSGSGQ